jgi:hypothetical protein
MGALPRRGGREPRARGVGGLGRSNLKNYRQIALTWPALGIRQTSGESRYLADIRQTLSAESLPALPTGSELQPWQDDAWLLKLRRELSFSRLLGLKKMVTFQELGRSLGPQQGQIEVPLVPEALDCSTKDTSC